MNMIIKKITLAILLCLVTTPCLSKEPSQPISWEKIENSSYFQKFDYNTRKRIRFNYFNKNIAKHKRYLGFDRKTKIKVCVNWLKQELNDKSLADWKNYIYSMNKKRDKCISKAAKEASTDGGFHFLVKKCRDKFQTNEKISSQRNKYILSNKEITDIKIKCENQIKK